MYLLDKASTYIVGVSGKRSKAYKAIVMEILYRVNTGKITTKAQAKQLKDTLLQTCDEEEAAGDSAPSRQLYESID